MWKRVYEFFVWLATTTQRQKRQDKALSEQAEKIDRLTTLVTHLAFEYQRTQDELRRVKEDMTRLAEHEADEREKLLLQFEVRRLKEKLKLLSDKQEQAEDADDQE